MLYGSEGKDILKGSRGADDSYGWEDVTAKDVLVLAQCHTGVTKGSMGTVYGFVSGEDKLDFRDLGGRNFVGATTFKGNGVGEIVFDKSIRSIDTDGDAVADVAIELWYVKPLTVDGLLL